LSFQHSFSAETVRQEQKQKKSMYKIKRAYFQFSSRLFNVSAAAGCQRDQFFPQKFFSPINSGRFLFSFTTASEYGGIASGVPVSAVIYRLNHERQHQQIIQV